MQVVWLGKVCTLDGSWSLVENLLGEIGLWKGFVSAYFFVMEDWRFEWFCVGWPEGRQTLVRF